jgi:hypothetical protein
MENVSGDEKQAKSVSASSREPRDVDRSNEVEKPPPPRTRSAAKAEKKRREDEMKENKSSDGAIYVRRSNRDFNVGTQRLAAVGLVVRLSIAHIFFSCGPLNPLVDSVERHGSNVLSPPSHSVFFSFLSQRIRKLWGQPDTNEKASQEAANLRY